MKILLIHNYYQHAGGEDAVLANEQALLHARGHAVRLFTVSNKHIKSLWDKVKTARQTIYSRTARDQLARELARSRPDVVHVHNFFPLLSPSVYGACRDAGVPVVQTLHNYRPLCPNALFFRDGHACEDCLGKTVPWPGVIHGCYRGSRMASGAVAAMLATHHVSHTWTEMVDVYIALTEFARKKFIQGGLPAEKIVVKPNFVHPDSGPGEGQGRYALFVGRLSPEKGINTLLAAWERLGGRVPLKIVGDGPLAKKVSEAAGRVPRLEWLGRRSVEEVYELMGESCMLIFPSECYETFGRVAVEAFAKGTPVVAANIGAIAELVDHGRTGLHFLPGSSEDLAVQVEWALARPAELARMRREARAEFEVKYTADQNYQTLMEIYESAIMQARARV